MARASSHLVDSTSNENVLQYHDARTQEVEANGAAGHRTGGWGEAWAGEQFMRFWLNQQSRTQDQRISSLTCMSSASGTEEKGNRCGAQRTEGGLVC